MNLHSQPVRHSLSSQHPWLLNYTEQGSGQCHAGQHNVTPGSMKASLGFRYRKFPELWHIGWIVIGLLTRMTNSRSCDINMSINSFQSRNIQLPTLGRCMEQPLSFISLCGDVSYRVNSPNGVGKIFFDFSIVHFKSFAGPMETLAG
jgi:hypothetical protein